MTQPTEYKKTVRLTPEEQRQLELIYDSFNFTTENKVFKYLVSTHDSRIKEIDSLEIRNQKLEFELGEKNNQLQELQEAWKILTKFSKLKL